MAAARRRPPEGDSSAKDSKAGRRGKRGRTRPRRQDRGAFYTAEKNMLEFGLFAVEHEISGVSNLVSAQEKCGGCSSVGRVPDCDSGCRGFESHQPPQKFYGKQPLRAAVFFCAALFLTPGALSKCRPHLGLAPPLQDSGRISAGIGIFVPADCPRGILFRPASLRMPAGPAYCGVNASAFQRMMLTRKSESTIVAMPANSRGTGLCPGFQTRRCQF